jgi:outer membrane protein with glycine zipper
MKMISYILTVLILGVFVSGAVLAQDPIVYPAKGQSQEQTEKDKSDCYTWAKKETGFDPMETPKASSQPPPQQQSSASAGRGAVGGGLAGLAIGSLSGNAGRGAAIGAVTGGVVGGARRSNQQQQQQQAQDQWAQQEAAQYSKKRETYNRAYGACLQGRGYTVK